MNFRVVSALNKALDGSGAQVLATGSSTARVQLTRGGQPVEDPADAEEADIDLLGHRFPADHQILGTAPPPGLRSIHIHNATLEFSGKDIHFMADQTCSTFRFSNIKFVFNTSAFSRQEHPSSDQSLFIACGRDCTMALEDCVLETSFDSPALAHLVVCWATDGGQVTATRCKFSGFRRILDVDPGSEGLMKDCVVDVAIKGSFGDGPKDNLAITADGEGALLHMTDCQLSISCARICSVLLMGFLHFGNGCRAELEGVTFVGHSDFAAAKNAPAISMMLCHQALTAGEQAHVQMRGCTFVNGRLASLHKGTLLDLDNCHISGSFLGRGSIQLAGGGSASLRHCTVQNLCKDMSSAKTILSAVALMEDHGEVGRVDLEDCLLETMTGGCILHASAGEATLTRCTLRKQASSPAALMAVVRHAALLIDGPANVTMQHCYVEAGLNQAAAIVGLKGQLTCKDSLLVGWGGATDQDQSSCHIVCAAMPGSLIKMQRCTLQYHPDSKHTLGSDVVLVSECGHVALSQCRLIGPAPGNASPMRAGIGAMRGGTATMDKCTISHVEAAAAEYTGKKGSAVKVVDCLMDKVAMKPAPLKVPEGTGGSGCSAEVAAKAEALCAAGPGMSMGQQAGGAGATAPASSALVECAVCHRKPGDPGVPATLKLCGGCHSARYCSAECQREDWKMGHKAICKLFRAEDMRKNPKQQASGKQQVS